MTANVGEYGLPLNINLNFDVSAATSLQISIVKPDGSAFAAVATVGQVDLVVDGQGTYKAKQYITYITQPGDLSEPGDHFARVIYTDATKRLISDPTSFTVSP